MTASHDAPSAGCPCKHVGALVTRLVVPAWIAAGATMKLVENDPRNLPKPLFNAIVSTDGMLGLSGVAWMDAMLRTICGVEFILAAIILCMPRCARPLAMAVLGVFCAILLYLIGTGWANDGFDAVLKGSCGCFGKSGINPLYMLMIDGALLIVVLRSSRASRSCATATPPMCKGGTPAAVLSFAGLAFAYGKPAPTVVVIEPPAPIVPAPIGITPGPTIDPPPPVVPAAGAWPSRPATVQPYYLPEFEKWVGARLDAQPELALLDAPPPADLQHGTWFVMLYRADCEHCHEVLGTYFAGALKHPTLLIGIPDFDPGTVQPMPCGECEIRSFVAGPNYVVQTPVVMRVKDGVVEAVCTDHEDPASLATVLEGDSR